jgi:deazaflavin-dependent oxidoreductase (nitroreductase family)
MRMPRFYENGIRIVSRVHGWLFRTFGRPRYLGRDLALVTVRGRKSGRDITVPLLYLPLNGSVYIAASYMGNDRSPQWYLNMVKDPYVRARISGVERAYRARTLSGAEADSVWPALFEMYPSFEAYKKRTAREISVVELKPVAS